VEWVPKGKSLVRIDFWEFITDNTRYMLARRGGRQEDDVHLWMLQRELWKEQGTLENLTPRCHIVLKHYPQLFDYRVSAEQLEYQYFKLMQMEEHPLFRRLKRKFLYNVSFMNAKMEEISRLDRLARRDSEDEVLDLSDSDESITTHAVVAAVQEPKEGQVKAHPSSNLRQNGV
jgi:hypothetical protein